MRNPFWISAYGYKHSERTPFELYEPKECKSCKTKVNSWYGTYCEVCKSKRVLASQRINREFRNRKCR